MTVSTDITADAIALQERDEFRSTGWLKVIAPAKVNLHLAIGKQRPDGYHDAFSIMHELMLHDVVYLKRTPQQDGPTCTMVGCGDVKAPEIAPEGNLAVKAVQALARACDRPASDDALAIRIEKNIPAQGGLGGGSTDAAAALIGATYLWGLDPDDARIEATARSLGADVAFFLRGGCAALSGTGDTFEHALEPSNRALALVKPEGGVSTAAAYRAFDESPIAIPPDIAANARSARRACDVRPFNNLAPAAEQLRPELADIRLWLSGRSGVESALLCGSGATTFAVCSDFATATSIVTSARAQGWWARATSFMRSLPQGKVILS